MSAGEYEFQKKPWRMTSPPQNLSKWLPGFEGVEVRLHMDPTDIAIIARECTWGDPFTLDLEDEELRSTVIEELKGGKVLGGAFEVPAFGFLIRGSRSTMDQMLRLREAAGAAQTTRDNDFRNFNIIVPDTIENLNRLRKTNHIHEGDGYPASKLRDLEREKFDDQMLYDKLTEHIQQARDLYGELVDRGVPPQDARYLCLPLGAQTHWMQIQDLRATMKMCEQRLCNGLTQHETDYIVRLMRDEVVKLMPWTDKVLRSACEKRGECVSRSMLFPACGAFVDSEKVETFKYETMNIPEDPEGAYRLEITKFDPDQHLYSNEQNAGMIMAKWDIERQKLEKENPDVIFTMAGPPVSIFEEGV